MPSCKTPKSMHVRLCTVTSANTAGQDTCPKSALHTEINVGNAAKITISRQSVHPCRDNRGTGGARRHWKGVPGG